MEKVVCQAVGELCEGVGGGGGYEEKVMFLGDTYVLDGTGQGGFGTGGGEDVGDDFAPCERGKGESRDELLSGTGENDLDFVAIPNEQTGEFSSFVSCDPARYTQNNAHEMRRF